MEQNFTLERHPLCPDRFMSERMNQRLQRRILKSAHLARPLVIRNLLTEEEIRLVYSYARAVGDNFDQGNNRRQLTQRDANDSEDDDEDGRSDEQDPPEPGSAEWMAEQMRLTAQMNEYYDAADDQRNGAEADADDEVVDAGWVSMSGSHRKLWLHRGGPTGADGVWTRFGDACPAILAKLLQTMHASGLQDSVWRRCSQKWLCDDSHRYCTSLAGPWCRWCARTLRGHGTGVVGNIELLLRRLLSSPQGASCRLKPIISVSASVGADASRRLLKRSLQRPKPLLLVKLSRHQKKKLRMERRRSNSRR